MFAWIIPVLTWVGSFFTNLIKSGPAVKIALSVAFVAMINLGVDKLLDYAFSYGLPVLPEMVLALGTKSGLFVALNIYLKIIVFGFSVKQTIAFFRSVT